MNGSPPSLGHLVQYMREGSSSSTYTSQQNILSSPLRYVKHLHCSRVVLPGALININNLSKGIILCVDMFIREYMLWVCYILYILKNPPARMFFY